MSTTLFRVLLRNGSRSGVRIAVAVLGTAVAGCTVGPDFEAPKPPSVTRYTSPGETTVPGPDATKEVPRQAIVLGERVVANWWTLFRSSQLDVLVKQAIAGNYTLESVKAKLEQAREAVTVASSALYPQIGLSASESEQKQSAATFGLTPEVAPLPPSFNLFQVGPTASYTPDLFGQTHRRIEQQVCAGRISEQSTRRGIFGSNWQHGFPGASGCCSPRSIESPERYSCHRSSKCGARAQAAPNRNCTRQRRNRC